MAHLCRDGCFALLVMVWVGLAACGSGTEPASLADAVDDRDADLISELLDAGADPEQPRVLGMTPLMRAANRADLGSVLVLIDGGADIDAVGDDGLAVVQIAARADAAAVTEALLDAGADPSVRSSSGMSALDQAADAGAVDVIDVLVDHGMDLDRRSEVVAQGHGHPRDVGSTPLALAVRADRIETVTHLLALGADVDAESESGNTPLLVAVYSDASPEVVQALLAAGADIGARGVCHGGCGDGTHGPAGLTVSEWAELLGRDDLDDLFSEG